MDKDELYAEAVGNITNLIHLRNKDKKELISKGQSKGIEIASITNEINTLKSCLTEILIFID